MELKSALDKVPPKKIIGAGTGVLVLGVILGWFGFPALLHSQMASNLVLKKGGMARQIWEKVPFPINFKVYIFNVTNPLEVHKGAKPVLNEIGPYWYDEYKEKVNLEDRTKDDTVAFNMKDTFIFNKEKSGRLTGDEMITVPHLLLVGMILAVEYQKPAGLKLLNKALPLMFNKPETIFITAKARDLMWDGVPVDCSSTDFAAKAVCSELRKQEKMFKKVDDNTFKFSYLGQKNASLSGRFRVKRGMQNISDLGRVVEFEGQPQLSVWDGDECNKFQGTDSTIFPPFREISDIIAVFVPDICRSLPADYEEPSEYRGLPADMYSAEFGDMSSDPHLACFCTTPTTCLKKGVHDITRCTGGVPIVTSLPHFFAADEEYQTGVVGLRPNRIDHASYFKFQRFTGVPVTGFKRLQFALPLHPIDKVDLMKEVPTVMHPVFWVEESLELEGDLLAQLKLVFTVLDVLEGLKWFMITAGGALGVGGAVLHFKKRTGEAALNQPPAFHRKITTGVAPLEAKSPQRY